MYVSTRLHVCSAHNENHLLLTAGMSLSRLMSLMEQENGDCEYRLFHLKMLPVSFYVNECLYLYEFPIHTLINFKPYFKMETFVCLRRREHVPCKVMQHEKYTSIRFLTSMFHV